MDEGKYIIQDGRLVNKDTGVAIPEDEPVFVLRAHDANAVKALTVYADCCQVRPHKEAVLDRITVFEVFQDLNPDKMKEPD